MKPLEQYPDQFLPIAYDHYSIKKRSADIHADPRVPEPDDGPVSVYYGT